MMKMSEIYILTDMPVANNPQFDTYEKAVMHLNDKVRQNPNLRLYRATDITAQAKETTDTKVALFDYIKLAITPYLVVDYSNPNKMRNKYMALLTFLAIASINGSEYDKFKEPEELGLLNYFDFCAFPNGIFEIDLAFIPNSYVPKTKIEIPSEFKSIVESSIDKLRTYKIDVFNLEYLQLSSMLEKYRMWEYYYRSSRKNYYPEIIPKVSFAFDSVNPNNKHILR